MRHVERGVGGEEIAWWEHLGVVKEMLNRLNVAHPNDGLDRSLRIDRVVHLHIKAYSMSDRSW